ncbi:hypothetical protein GGX14DRAFT_578106 [Mycena pura]|uniref:DUF6699 domain-containing protein n=1 Tax=Mycena pura TaxID=153505 RepID=A0AAD6XYD3_9AGAR|nr:hypothetical protein GGX14DRAFT_578106 [Mycena pura]
MLHALLQAAPCHEEFRTRASDTGIGTSATQYQAFTDTAALVFTTLLRSLKFELAVPADVGERRVLTCLTSSFAITWRAANQCATGSSGRLSLGTETHSDSSYYVEACYEGDKKGESRPIKLCLDVVGRGGGAVTVGDVLTAVQRHLREYDADPDNPRDAAPYAARRIATVNGFCSGRPARTQLAHIRAEQDGGPRIVDCLLGHTLFTGPAPMLGQPDHHWQLELAVPPHYAA